MVTEDPNFSGYTIEIPISFSNGIKTIGDILEELGHMKNLGYRDLQIITKRKNEKISNMSTYCIIDLNIFRSCLYPSALINGVCLIKYDKSDDSQDTKLLNTSIMDVADTEDDDLFIIKFVETIYKEIMGLITYQVKDLNVSEEEKISIIEETSKSYSIIMRSAESITNIDATGCGSDEAHDNTKERLSINLDDIGLEIVNSLDNRMKFYSMEVTDKINNKIFRGYSARTLKETTIFLINLWTKNKPEKFSILISYPIPEELKEVFNNEENMITGLWYERINPCYNTTGDNIMYAMDSITPTIPGKYACIEYDIFKFRDRMNKFISSAIKAFKKNFCQYCDDYYFDEDKVSINISYYTMNNSDTSSKEIVKDILTVTQKDYEDLYRKENKNYDERKYND